MRLGGRAFELLCVMVERQGEVVTREELFAAAWPGLHVHDGNLKVNIANLRRALGDDDDPPRFVATVPRRGYRFVAPVIASAAPDLQERPTVGLPVLDALPPTRGIIGRAREVSALAGLLNDELEITVVGAGGVGKTALAIEVAHAVGASFPGGVHFVDLSPIGDPALLPAALLQAMLLPTSPADALTTVIGYLCANRTLLLLDNCEHLQHAVAIFAGKFLASGGKSRLLATSRFPLGATSERTFPVAPLHYAAADEALDVERAMQLSAIEMLVTRAAELGGYQLVDEDCAPVAHLCRALDGLPLAIELAAAELGRQGLGKLIAMLDQPLTALRRADGAAPLRHWTLQAAIDWTYGLLSHDEMAVFRLVSVFPDTFNQEDAVAVAVAACLSTSTVAGCLGSLLTKSLLSIGTDESGFGFRMLNTTRLYAVERRRRDPLDARIQLFHARRVLALFERSELEWDWRENGRWVAQYRERLPDLRAALSWALDTGKDPSLGVRLAAAALPLWFELSAMTEALSWAEAALCRARTAPLDDLALAKLTDLKAWLAVYDAKPMPEVKKAWLAAIDASGRAGTAGHHLRALAALALYRIRTGSIE